MTTFAETLAAIKRQARITGTDRDTQIGDTINEAWREIAGKDFFPFLRTATTQVLTAGTQEYTLPSDFGQFATESLRVYVTGTTNYSYIEYVTPPDGELWNNFDTGYIPGAAMLVAGTTDLLRKVRLMPNFSATTLTFGFTYYKRVADKSSTDPLGSPDICDYILWKCLSMDKDWCRDNEGSNQATYEARAKQAERRARSNLLP